MLNAVDFGASSAPWGEAHFILLLAAHYGRLWGGVWGPYPMINGVPWGKRLTVHASAFASRGGVMGAGEWRSFRRLEIMAALGLFRLATTHPVGLARYVARDFPLMTASDRANLAGDLEAFVEHGPEDLAKIRRSLDVMVLEWGSHALPLTPDLRARRDRFFGCFERAALLAAA